MALLAKTEPWVHGRCKICRPNYRCDGWPAYVAFSNRANPTGDVSKGKISSPKVAPAQSSGFVTFTHPSRQASQNSAVTNGKDRHRDKNRRPTPAVARRATRLPSPRQLLHPQPRVPPPGPRPHRAGRRVPGPVHVAQPPAPVAAALDAQRPAPARRQLQLVQPNCSRRRARPRVPRI